MESANALPCIGWLPPITFLRGLHHLMKYGTLMATSRTLMRAISRGERAKRTLTIANVMDEHRAGYVTQLQSEMDWRRVMLKSTPGPWAWFGNRSGGVYLATPDRGRLYIMGFRRYGMNGAQPTFRVGSIMRPAAELVAFAVGDGTARGFKEADKDPSVYRYDVREIDHPDARLIAAAPDLLAAALAWEAAEDARNDCDGEDGCDNEGPWEHCPFCSERFGEAIDMRHAAIACALGGVRS